jgi:hypothetical protein
MTGSTLARSALVAAAVAALLCGRTSNARLAEVEKKERLEKVHLGTFDDLDFTVFTGQKWDQLGRSHARNIIVHWPDGRATTGIDAPASRSSCPWRRSAGGKMAS